MHNATPNDAPDHAKAAASDPTKSESVPVPRGVAMCGVVALSGLIWFQGNQLWSEFEGLQSDQVAEQTSTVVGYPEISPNPSFAEPPDDWFPGEKLWSHWDPNSGHQWFAIERGALDSNRISKPVGRDFVRAIDTPLVEVGSGPYWSKIPAIHEVAAFEHEGVACGYPIRVLQKVMVVNDLVNADPLLVLFTPGRTGTRLDVFDAKEGETRLHLGAAGYIYSGNHVLYDRGTNSLWIAEEAGLRAVSGAKKGTVLPRVASPAIMAFGDWSSDHPDGRLVVGADRTTYAPSH